MYPGAYLNTFPNKPAVITAETGEVVTYAELESNSIRIARHLYGLGLRPGDHLAAVATNTPKVFDIYWAAMRSGLYMTMVNWHLTAGEAAYIVNDCGAKAVIVDAALTELAGALLPLTPDTEHRLAFGGNVDGYSDLDAAAAAESDVPMEDQPRGTDMLYSSGTTGQPKGIKPPLPGRQVSEPGDKLTETNQTVWGVGPDTVALSPAPLYHSAPLRWFGVVQALGGTVILVDRFDAEKTLQYIAQFGVTHSQWVPTMLIRMLKLPEDVRLGYDVSSLRVAIHAAAPCPVETKRHIIEWWGPIVWEFYSATEYNGMTIVNSEEWLRKPGTVGRAALGVPHICDGDGNDVAAGQIGTVFFERDALPFEYHNAPEKTRSAQHPAHPAWTTTGDLGYLDEDGYLFLTDRDSFLIISGGVNIYPQEIENVLVEHPKVLDAGVIGMPDAELGEIVTAVVTPAPGVEGDEGLRTELMDHLSEHIARYKLPRSMVFNADLPRTPTGKLVKRKLKEQLLAGTVDTSA
ncbi:acyl-CoA synthetase [Nocardia sp. 348MFTsu5.1]|uniref:acyl-CoA synthetase n=1 Tax=Nocardia sp. 348MFTsu5.1 TaxID=1172185 RepID=UPI0003689D0F|nr:acyl-CoA synthetase [Nocardia sp. 348MFTsu5.1]